MGSYTEKAKLHLARAFLMNPEVMVLERPLMHFNPDWGVSMILDLFRTHVCNRGVGMPEALRNSLRPRTLFYAAETVDQLRAADVAWEVLNGRIKEMPNYAGSGPTARAHHWRL